VKINLFPVKQQKTAKHTAAGEKQLSHQTTL
jgi:hypothetical protein